MTVVFTTHLAFSNKIIFKLMMVSAVLLLPFSAHAAGEGTAHHETADKTMNHVDQEASESDLAESDDSDSYEYSDDELASESHSDDSDYDYTGYGSTSFGFRPQ